MLTRRTALTYLAAGALLPRAARAATLIELGWDDLIPPGVPYSEIVAEGEIDILRDSWNPVYDANGTKLNHLLDGAYIKMPGFVIPLDVAADGVRDFILVPYVGACIHTPPPPANQLVIVSAEKAWPSNQLWDPVWVTGTMRTQLQKTEMGQTGYAIEAEEMEVYVW